MARQNKTKRKSLLGLRTGHVSAILLIAFVIGMAFIGSTNEHSTSAATQRFPGDPNPKVTGKAFFGASGDHIASYEASTGKPMSLYRTFVSDWGSRNKAVTDARSATNAGRLPWVSIKTPGWGTLASGSRNSELDALLRDLDAIGKPVWFTVHHEMENDTQSSGEYTSANYRAMQSHVRARMNAVGTHNIAFAPIYGGFTFGSGSGRNPNDWYVAGIWDFIGVDHYAPSASQNPLRQRWYDTVSWIESKGLPYGVGEWGNRDYDNAAQSATEMQAFWDWGWSQNNDAVGYSYFDSGANSPDGTWELWGARLTTFLNILGSNKVMRLSDLGSSTPPPPPASTPDTTAPSVVLASPSNNATVSGNIMISGTASDNVGVTKVSLYIDNSLTNTDTTTPYTFDINTQTYSNGVHTIQLKVFDAANNIGQSATVSVTVSNTTASPGGSSGGTGGQDSGSTTTVISADSLPSNNSQPVPVSGQLVIQPSQAGSEVKLQIDGKPVTGTSVDTTKLTNGTHTLTITEDDKVKHVAIEVNNPWHVAAINEFRASPVKYVAVSSLGLVTLCTGLWMARARIFQLLHRLKTRNYIHFGS